MKDDQDGLITSSNKYKDGRGPRKYQVLFSVIWCFSWSPQNGCVGNRFENDWWTADASTFIDLDQILVYLDTVAEILFPVEKVGSFSLDPED